MFNARVHYTVLTQHPNHQPAHTNHAHQQNDQAPKKGDNAPDTQQCTNIQTILFNCAQHCVSQSAIQTLDFVLKAYLPPGISLNNVGSMTLAHSTNTCHQPVTARAQLCPIIKLLRKEVIHPHLPVRVPCYDFVPIADPTFDGSLTSLGHRLRVLPTFMT